MKRKKLSRPGSKKLFTVTAKKVHKKNLVSGPMRGGTRL